MAASILTIFQDMIYRPDEANFKHALSFAPGCDNLEDQDWQMLERLEGDRLFQKIADLYPKYYRFWRLYKKPGTAEEWQEVKWKNYMYDMNVMAEIFGEAQKEILKGD